MSEFNDNILNVLNNIRFNVNIFVLHYTSNYAISS